MKCYIVKDLLPNYIDGLTCEEVNMEIKKHLEECKGCRTIYKQMSLPVSRESIPEDENIDFLKKLKGKIREICGCHFLNLCGAGCHFLFPAPL